MRTFIVLGGLAALISILAVARGSRSTLWWGLPAILLLTPTYIHHAINGHVGGQAMLLVGILIGGSIGPLTRLRWTWTDTLVMLIWIAQLASDGTNNKITTVPLVLMLFYTLIPYFLGRVFLRSWEDVGSALRPLMICVGLLAASVTIEALTGFSVFRALFSKNSVSVMRAGFHRAMGTHTHPIIQGLTLLLAWPWTLEAARRARAGLGPKWWRALPWLVVIAIFGTVSRGPMAAAIIACGVYLFFSRPSWRMPLATMGVAMAIMFFVGFDQIRNAMLVMSGESEAIEAEGVHYKVINGEEYAYNGTDHRWLLFKAYAIPLSNAGLLGFGYGEAEGSQEVLAMNASFWSIDNTQIVWILTYGYLGLALFYAFALVVMVGLTRVGLDRANPFSTLASGMAAALVAFHVALLSVALIREYHPDWMFFMGAAVTVVQLARQMPTARPPRNVQPLSPNPWPQTFGR